MSIPLPCPIWISFSILWKLILIFTPPDDHLTDVTNKGNMENWPNRWPYVGSTGFSGVLRSGVRLYSEMQFKQFCVTDEVSKYSLFCTQKCNGIYNILYNLKITISIGGGKLLLLFVICEVFITLSNQQSN